MSIPEGLKKVDKRFLRDIPNWPMAPVPLCMGGDVRALSWCCKPGYSLTFGFKCMRDFVLSRIGLSPAEFIRIKEEFSEILGWHYPEPCFGSLSYCCMRRGGCPGRDAALKRRYPNMDYEERLAEYYKYKRILAVLLLKAASNTELTAPFIEDLELGQFGKILKK